jgi:hypothetical protein
MKEQGNDAKLSGQIASTPIEVSNIAENFALRAKKRLTCYRGVCYIIRGGENE